MLSTVPEGPPRRFRWRAQVHRVAHADGPERIATEWWRAPEAPAAADAPAAAASGSARDGAVRRGAADRDYYRVECEAGHRLWLYRDGPHAPGRPAAWFVHGLFA